MKKISNSKKNQASKVIIIGSNAKHGVSTPLLKLLPALQNHSAMTVIPTSGRSLIVDKKTLGRSTFTVGVLDTSSVGRATGAAILAKITPAGSARQAARMSIIEKALPFALNGQLLASMYMKAFAKHLATNQAYNDLESYRTWTNMVSAWINIREITMPLTTASSMNTSVAGSTIKATDFASNADNIAEYSKDATIVAGLTGAFQLAISVFHTEGDDNFNLMKSMMVEFIKQVGDWGKTKGAIEMLSAHHLGLKKKGVRTAGVAFDSYVSLRNMSQAALDHAKASIDTQMWRGTNSLHAAATSRIGSDYADSIHSNLAFLCIAEYFATLKASTSYSGTELSKGFVSYAKSFTSVKAMAFFAASGSSDSGKVASGLKKSDLTAVKHLGGVVYKALEKHASVSSITDFLESLYVMEFIRTSYTGFITQLDNNLKHSALTIKEIIQRIQRFNLDLVNASSDLQGTTYVTDITTTSNIFTSSLAGALYHAAYMLENVTDTSIASMISRIKPVEMVAGWSKSSMATVVKIDVLQHPLTGLNDSLLAGVAFSVTLLNSTPFTINTDGVILEIDGVPMSEHNFLKSEKRFQFYYDALSYQALTSADIIAAVLGGQIGDGISKGYSYAQTIKESNHNKIRSVNSAAAVQMGVHYHAERLAVADHLLQYFDLANCCIRLLSDKAFESFEVIGRDQSLKNATELRDSVVAFIKNVIKINQLDNILADRTAVTSGTGLPDVRIRTLSDDKSEGKHPLEDKEAFKAMTEFFYKKANMNMLKEAIKTATIVYGDEGTSSTHFKDCHDSSDLSFGMISPALSVLLNQGTVPTTNNLKRQGMEIVQKITESLKTEYNSKNFFFGENALKSFYVPAQSLLTAINANKLSDDLSAQFNKTLLAPRRGQTQMYTLPNSLLALLQINLGLKTQKWYTMDNNSVDTKKRLLQEYSDTFVRLMTFASSPYEGVEFGMVPTVMSVAYVSDSRFFSDVLAIVGLSPDSTIMMKHAHRIEQYISKMAESKFYPLAVIPGALADLDDSGKSDSERVSLGKFLRLSPNFQSVRKTTFFDGQFMTRELYFRDEKAMDLINSNVLQMTYESGNKMLLMRESGKLLLEDNTDLIFNLTVSTPEVLADMTYEAGYNPVDEIVHLIDVCTEALTADDDNYDGNDSADIELSGDDAEVIEK